MQRNGYSTRHSRLSQAHVSYSKVYDMWGAMVHMGETSHCDENITTETKGETNHVGCIMNTHSSDSSFEEHCEHDTAGIKKTTRKKTMTIRAYY